MPKDDNCKSDKRISKCLLITIVFTLFLVLGGTVFFTTQNSAVQERIAQKKLEKETFIWPETDIASLIPVPQSTNGHIGHSSEKAFSVDVYNTSEEDFWEYCQTCRVQNHGFRYFDIKNGNNYSAYDWYGNLLRLSFDDINKTMHVHIYEPDEVRLLRGIVHYELEYYSYPYSSHGGNHYNSVVKKYLTPKKTTIGLLKKDFPFSESTYGSTIIKKGIKLSDDTEIWVYASCLDDYNSSLYRFTYDRLSISDDRMDIQTHFELLQQSSSSLDKTKLIVLSIIPVNQSSDNMYNLSSEDIDDLVYYGKSAIQLYKGSNMIIRLAFLDDYDSLKSVCVYNCQTKQEVQLPISDEVRYTAEDNGFYYIYAIKDDGEFVDLSNRIGIEHAYTTDDEFIIY